MKKRNERVSQFFVQLKIEFGLSLILNGSQPAVSVWIFKAIFYIVRDPNGNKSPGIILGFKSLRK